MADKPITINNFQEGMAASSFLGFEEIRNVNVYDKPGAAFPNGALAKHSGTSVTGRITWQKTSGSEHWAIDSSGAVYDISGSTYTKRTGFSSNTGQGLEIWKDHVFVVANTSVNVLKLSDNSVITSWDGSTIDSASANLTPSVVGQDGKLYIGAGRYVYSLQEVSGETFDPSDATTFVYTKRALELPEDYIITSICELGTWLAIGTKKSNSSDVADVFLWDRTSVSFNLPLRIIGNGVKQMITMNNLLFVHAGDYGQWYVSNGSSIQKFAKLPKTLGNHATVCYPGAVTQFNERIYFGILAESTYNVPFGIYSLDPDTGGFILEHTISTGNISDNNSKSIGSIIAKGGILYASWMDNTTYGVDYSTSTQYTGDKAHITSAFMRLGARLNKKHVKGVEIQLTKPLVSGASVKVYYRTAQNASWTELFTLSTVGEQSGLANFVKSVESAQFKIVLNGNVELLDVTLI